MIKIPYFFKRGLLLHEQTDHKLLDLSTIARLRKTLAPAVCRLQFQQREVCDYGLGRFLRHSKSNGSCFLVKSTIFASAAHVFAGGAGVEKFDLAAVNRNGARRELEIKFQDVTNDFGLLSCANFDACPLNMRPVDEPLEKGEPFYCLGFPGDKQNNETTPKLFISPGSYLARQSLDADMPVARNSFADDHERKILRFAMACVPGQSGAPVVDRFGRVIGLFVASGAWQNRSSVQPLLLEHRMELQNLSA